MFPNLVTVAIRKRGEIMKEIIMAIVQIIFMAIGYYCMFRLGYRQGIKDAEELFWGKEREVCNDKNH